MKFIFQYATSHLCEEYSVHNHFMIKFYIVKLLQLYQDNSKIKNNFIISTHLHIMEKLVTMKQKMPPLKQSASPKSVKNIHKNGKSHTTQTKQNPVFIQSSFNHL